MKAEPTYTLEEASVKTGKRINSLLCDVINGDLVISADFSGLGGVPALRAKLEVGDAFDGADQISYGSSEASGITGVWDLYLMQPIAALEVVGNEIKAMVGSGGLFFGSKENGDLVVLGNSPSSEVLSLPNGARWVVKEKNLLVCTLVAAQTDDDLAGSKQTDVINRVAPTNNSKPCQSNEIDTVRDAEISARHRQLKAEGCKNPTQTTAKEFGVSDTVIKKVIKRSKEGRFCQAKMSLLGQLRSR